MNSIYLLHLPYGTRAVPLLTTLFTTVFCDTALILLVLLRMTANASGALSLASVVFTIPFVILAFLGGRLADRMPKRAALILDKHIEFWILIFSTLVLIYGSPVMLPWLLFCIGIKEALFLPAYCGILHETFAEKNLSKVVGDSYFTAFLAGTAAMLAGPHFSRMVLFSGKPEVSSVFWILIVSVIGFFLSFRMYPTAIDAGRDAQERRRHTSSLKDGILALCAKPSCIGAMLGSIFFILFFTAVEILLFQMFRATLRNISPTDPFRMTQEVLFPGVVFAICIGIGSCFCGRISGKIVECGLVPYGALGLAIFLPLAALVPGPVASFSSSFEIFWGEQAVAADFQCYPLQILWLVLAGIIGGLFPVPLRAYLHKEIPPEKRGAAFSVFNALLFFCFAILFTLKSPNDLLMNPWVLRNNGEHLPAVLTVVGLLPLIVTILAGFFLPRLVVRCAAVLLTHTFFRLTVHGLENIPSKGAALLVSSHNSYADSLLILACTSRRIRFLMHEKFYRHPMIHPFAKMVGVIEVPASGQHRIESMLENIRAALKQGDLVCVFPEGRVSLNGLMGDFKAGYAKMIPENSDIPLIPISVGMVWGSIFSNYYQKIRLRLSLSYPARISIGKPMKLTDVDTAFRLRQAISVLETEACLAPRKDEKTLHYQFAKNAKRHPFRKIICQYGGKEMTYMESLIAAVVLSRQIRKEVDDAKYVGILLPNTAALAIGLVAIMMADKVPSPMNFTVSPETLRKSMQKAGITTIFTSRKFLEKIHMEPMPEMIMLEDVAQKISKVSKLFWALACIVLPHQELMACVSPQSHREVESTAALLFSSGSTGHPKGVMLSHHNLNSNVHSVVRVVGWTKNDRMLGSLPLFHSFGLLTGFWLPLMIGCKTVLLPSPLDARAVGDALKKYKLTIMLATPTFILTYLRKCPPDVFASVRLAIVGAEKLRKDIAQRFQEVTNGGPALIEGYGCTELSPIVAVNIGRNFMEIGKVCGKEGSIGLAMAGISVKIVDPVTREELPPGTDGLMLVKGPNVMQGYVGDPVLTANVISDGWYETGDIAHMDPDGYIFISGRISRFSKIAGEMVPHELLECIMGEIIGKDDRVLAVGGIPDAAKGEALVVVYLKDKMTVTPEEMTEHLRKHNIPNLWIPRTANYRAVDALPVTGTGKLDLMHLNEFIKKEFGI